MVDEIVSKHGKFSKFLIFAFVFISATVLIITLYQNSVQVRNINVNMRYFYKRDGVIVEDLKIEEHSTVVEEYFKARSNLSLTVLGNVLFKNASRPKMRERHYKISIWKYGRSLEMRHFQTLHEYRANAFEDCPVNNCDISYDENDLKDADAVLFPLHPMKNVRETLNLERSNHQRWIFFTDQSPENTFLHRRNNNWRNYFNTFNWSMSYKIESDIPVPYGRTLPLDREIGSMHPILEIVPYGYSKRRDVLAAIVLSNCVHNRRLRYLRELQEYLDVDVYGRCGTKLKTVCPGHDIEDCPSLNNYLFYLVFENAECDEYMTEKLFWNAYAKGAIPIILGPLRKYCKILLPPNSYIHVDDYARPIDLARHLLYLNRTWHANMFNFHQWRRHFRVVNEHGSVHYCRICEALNYNAEKSQILTNLDEFLSEELNCR